MLMLATAMSVPPALISATQSIPATMSLVKQKPPPPQTRAAHTRAPGATPRMPPFAAIVPAT
jgi:hypothetical protein